MIWHVYTLDAVFRAAFVDAGAPDQAVIERFLRKKHFLRPPVAYPDVVRKYYLLREDPRVSLCVLASSLEEWQGEAWVKVGIRHILGEFVGNRELQGQKGLSLQLLPMSLLGEPADRCYDTGQQALEAISYRILDMQRALRRNEEIAARYTYRRKV